MSYSKTDWTNNSAPAINADNLNKIEQGIYDNDAAIASANTNIGTLANLTTTEKSNLVGAINEVNSNTDINATNIGDLSDLETTTQTDIVSAINEVNSKSEISNDYGTAQNLGYSQEYVNDRFDGAKPMGDVVVDSIRTKNLLNLSSGGLFPNTSGTVVELAGYYNAIIDVSNMSNLYISGDFSLVGDGMVRIGKYSTYPKLGTTGARTGATSNGIIDVSTTNYLLLAFAPTATSTLEQIKNSFMLENGTNATTHTPYQNLGEYNEYYSTEELKIGYWVDGRPLYRKVVPFQITSGWQSFGSFSNVKDFTSIRCGKTGAGTVYPFYADANNFAYIYIPTSKSAIFLATSSGENTAQGYIIAEYTKTTD